MENTFHGRPQIWILSRGFKIMVDYKRESQTTSTISLQRYCNKVTTERQHHLGAVISSSKYKHKCVQNKTDEIIKKIKVLSMIAKSEPQTACTCFLTTFKHKPTFFVLQNRYTFVKTNANNSKTKIEIMQSQTRNKISLPHYVYIMRHNIYRT